MATQGTKYRRKQVLFTGAWLPAVDPLLAGDSNFTELSNMRYRPGGIEGIPGYSRINTSASVHTKGRAGVQLRSPYADQSRVVIQSFNSDMSEGRVWENKTPPPAAGNFEVLPLHIDAAGATPGRFSRWPNGNICYCNGKETKVWAGEEMRPGAFVNYAPDNSFRYDFSDVIQNTESDAKNVATLHRVAETVDTDTLLLLHLNGDVVDSSPTTPHTPTAHSLAYSTDRVFGTNSAVFDTLSTYISIPDDPDFDLSSGTWTIDMRIKLLSLPSPGDIAPIWYQETAGTGNDWIKIYVDENGAVHLKVKSDHGGAPAFDVEIATEDGEMSALIWYHVEIVESADDFYIFIDGVQKAYLESAGRAANYTGTVRIGNDGVDFMRARLDEFRLSASARHTSAFEIPVGSYGSAATRVYAILGSRRQLKGFKVHVENANTSAGTLAVDDWDGAGWAAVGSLVDGTAVGGVPIAAAGIVSFSSTVDHSAAQYIDGMVMYFYRIVITNPDDGITISHISVDAPWQDVCDLWDGIARTCLSFQIYRSGSYEDNTLNIAEEDYSSVNTATYADLSGLVAGTEFFVAGFREEMMGWRIVLAGDAVNTQANTLLTVYRWNGSAWETAGRLNDQTFEGNKSFAGSGVVSCAPADSNTEFPRQISSETNLYYYKFAFSQTLSGDVKLDYFAGIPAPKKLPEGYIFPFMFQGRAFLCGLPTHKQGGRIDYAMMETTEAWNGDDSSDGDATTAVPIYLGGSDDLVAACEIYNRFGSEIYNTAVFCKATETHLLNGYDGQSWRRYRISSVIGCAAAATMDAAEVGFSVESNAIRMVGIWLSDKGPVIFDGAIIISIKDGIECYFDTNDSRCINYDAIDKAWGLVNPARNEYDLCFPSGSATRCDTWLCMDLIRKRWFHKIPVGNDPYPQSAFRVQDAKGVYHCYGLRDDGCMLRLDHGPTWDGQAIVQVVSLSDLLPSESMWDYTKMTRLKLLAEAIAEDATISITHEADGSGVTSSLDDVSLQGGKRYVKAAQRVEKACYSHRLRFECSTSQVVPGFKPHAISYQYEVVREDV